MEPEKREFEIEWEGKKEKVVIKRLTFGERNDLWEEVAKIKVVGTQQVVDIKHGRMREIAILKSLMKAPFKISAEDIRNLPAQLGDLIYKEVDEFNTLGLVKKGS